MTKRHYVACAGVSVTFLVFLAYLIFVDHGIAFFHEFDYPRMEKVDVTEVTIAGRKWPIEKQAAYDRYDLVAMPLDKGTLVFGMGFSENPGGTIVACTVSTVSNGVFLDATSVALRSAHPHTDKAGEKAIFKELARQKGPTKTMVQESMISIEAKFQEFHILFDANTAQCYWLNFDVIHNSVRTSYGVKFCKKLRTS